ncbi:HU family DNA-binding protein [Sunxiuqinia elliptica]|uniref:DNA-binding protein HU-beta n=1 Tax=Sunxiuqinia elliptica TaxID=655355 RepID=A0A1I2KCY8_9BACT|nr:HU family DNA-binding protein [Sunxiuqinia elliptica]TDN96199.1 DNA-binding protein HU-beta [Sunxiuqinia elliptica]TDO67910.1 DNA-binding protein HU-beta [Sunxiuqinia elliptica]SFF64159.1 DNA-binding protein HU-beta [Sunxiuqinia elliptica]
MNKAQLIDAIADKAGLTKADAKKALDAFVESTTDALKNGDRVALIGFGSFAVATRSARTGRNPQSGAPIEIPEKKVVKFKPGAELSDAV